MSLLSQQFPFYRVWVEHHIEGGTVVRWAMMPEFRAAESPVFQLQACPYDNPNAPDWEAVGSTTTESYATDTTRRLYGMRLLVFYRVSVTANSMTYVSEPVGVDGILSDAQWLIAREIVRKETLRISQNPRGGFLLQRRREGTLCPTCTDMATKTRKRDRCVTCYDVGLVPPYLPTITQMCADLTPRQIIESHDIKGGRGDQREQQISLRIPAYHTLSPDDVWVDAASDERYRVREIEHAAELSGVPLVYKAALELIPHSDMIYRFPLGGETDDPAAIELPPAGIGSEAVTHDYGGADALAYVAEDGCGIAGAVVDVFTAADWAANRRTSQYVVATTTTDVNGRWTYELFLDPGDYVLRFEKTGAYGPDTAELEVLESDSQSLPSVDYFHQW